MTQNKQHKTNDTKTNDIKCHEWQKGITKKQKGEYLGMEKKPEIKILNNSNKYWEAKYDDFYVQVVKPNCNDITEIVNYGFMTPYFLIFEENKMSDQEAVDFAEKSGLASIAELYGGTVVFVYPTCEGGWANAKEDFFPSIIAKSKIGQYYEDGLTRTRDRFTGDWGEFFIRGALNRTCIFGYGASADFIAKNYLKFVEGEGFWGKCDIAPVTCILERLSVVPTPERRDIAVISVGNSDEINKALEENVDHVLVKDKADYVKDFHFMKKYRRMVGHFEEEDDLEALGLTVEPGYVEVETSADNRGDDKDTKFHKIGYVAYYNKAGMQQRDGLPVRMAPCCCKTQLPARQCGESHEQHCNRSNGSDRTYQAKIQCKYREDLRNRIFHGWLQEL